MINFRIKLMSYLDEAESKHKPLFYVVDTNCLERNL